MNKKNPMVFFLAIVSMFLVIGTISAAELVTIDQVRVNGIEDNLNNDISVIAGEITTVEVYFTALENASDVRIEARIRGYKVDISEKLTPMDLEEGKRYRKILNLKTPYELSDQVSDDLRLEISLWNNDHKTVHDDIFLRVQRPSYNAAVMSIETKDTIEAGELIQVTTYIKNVGYNYLNDVYITARIPEIGLVRTTYVGDLETTDEGYEDCCDQYGMDTVSARFVLEIPYDIQPGIYTLEVEAKNSDLRVESSKTIRFKNEFASGNLVASTLKRSFDKGETANYELLVVNPTDKLKVYRIVMDSPRNLDLSLRNSVVAVPAGSSKTLDIEASSEESGEYEFTANLFSGETLMSTIEMKAEVGEESVTEISPIVILTIVLAIVFLVLLVVLIVLLGRKPEKTEDFGESYY